MKRKKILILSFHNGDFKSSVERNIAHTKIVSELEKEGRKAVRMISGTTFSKTSFDDDSTVYSTNFIGTLRGVKFTHIYIDNNFKEEVEDLNKLIEVGEFNMMGEEFELWDTEGDRILAYTIEDGNLKVRGIDDDE